MLKSPYFHLAILCGCIAVFVPDCNNVKHFWEEALSILPNLLGFTLGGFSVLLAFGDSDFHSMLCGRDDCEGYIPSPFVSFAAMYMHFLVLQAVVLIFSLLVKSVGLESKIINFVGFVGLFYALFSGVAAIAGIFRQVGRYDRFVECKKKTVIRENTHALHEGHPKRREVKKRMRIARSRHTKI